MWTQYVVWGAIVLLLPFSGVQQDKKVDLQNQRLCSDDSECRSASCIRGVCDVFHCGNGIKDNQETRVDCGGPTCKPCKLWDKCGIESAKLIHAVWLLPNLYYRYYYGSLAAKYWNTKKGGLEVNRCMESEGPIDKNRCIYLDLLYDRFRLCDRRGVRKSLNEIDQYEVMFL